jgi:choline dehydrogenase-like flavoprotein
MSTSTEQRTHPQHEVVDAVVIGTGAGGAPLLWRLAKAGLKVVALEAGRWWHDPMQQYATDEIAQSKLYWPDERLSGGRNPTAFGGNNSGIGVGGSTLHYGAYFPRADRRDLRLRSEQGVAVDWPLDYGELQSKYEEVERFLGVSGPSTYPWASDRKYPLPPLALNTPAHIMRRGCDALGITTSPAAIAALSQPYNDPVSAGRSPCVHRGYCHQGCRNGAKASMDVTYLPEALEHGAEIRDSCFAHGIERDSSGLITAVLYDRDGRTERQLCRTVFLCAGAVETPRQLLMWDVGNSSDQVGRNFMAHVATQAWATFEEETNLYKGFPSTLITEDFMRPTNADFAGGYIVQSYGILPVTWSEQVSRSRPLLGQPLVDYLLQYPHVSGVGVNGETLPHRDNRVTLSDEKDSRGLPKPAVHFSLGLNEERLHWHAESTLRSILEAAGGRDTWISRRTAHTIGTCCMGRDPDESVVNPVGRSWEIPNLWIADNSVFPTSLAANPALTIMALALRTADAFLHGGATL